jgi:hypothetical protein
VLDDALICNFQRLYKGGSKIVYSVALDERFSYPVFHKQGSLLVRNIRDSVILPLQPAASEPLNVLLPCPRLGDAHHIAIRRWRQPSQEVSFDYFNSTTIVFKITAHVRVLSLTITGITRPIECFDTIAGAKLAHTYQDGEVHITKIECVNGANVVVHI